MFSKSQMSQALTGISGILVTPYDSAGDLRPALQAPIVERAIAAGVQILVANGNTGEYYTLTMEEAETMVKAAADHVAGRVPLLAGVGRGIRDACRLAETSARAGADALMIHQPPDPFASPRGLVAYVKEVAATVGDLPIVLYLRNDAVGLNTIAELCAIPSVIGVKWASPNPMVLARCVQEIESDVVWVGGLAETWAPAFYAVGARGFTSGLINVWPEQSVAIHAALEAGRWGDANALIREMRPFEDIRAEELNGTNVTGVKAALKALGHDCGATRPPSAWRLTPDQQSKMDAFIRDNKITPYQG